MLKKFLYTLISFCTILFVLSSCASATKLENREWMELDEEIRKEIQAATRALTTESATYALLRLKNFTISKEDLFSKDSPIYKEHAKIPAMTKRMEILSERIKTIVQTNATPIYDIITPYLYNHKITSNPLKLLFSVSDSYLLSFFDKNKLDVKKDLFVIVDELLIENDIYSEWDSIYTTYENWCLNIENISKISKLEPFERAEKRDLLSVLVDAIYQKWVTELRVGEQLTKNTAEQSQNESIRNILWETKQEEM